MVRFLSHLFVSIGLLLILLSSFFLYQRNDPDRLRFAGNLEILETQNEDRVVVPSVLVVHDLAIYVPIIPTKYDGVNWETTSDGVSYLETSPLPGEKGNSILYGHNWGSILGSLIKAKAGQEIEIIMSNGDHRFFTIQAIQEVKPTTLSVLDQSKDAMLTLYTCSGFFDQNRFVVTATPKAEIAQES